MPSLRSNVLATDAERTAASASLDVVFLFQDIRADIIKFFSKESALGIKRIFIMICYALHYYETIFSKSFKRIRHHVRNP